MHNNQIFPLWLETTLSPERIVELALEKESLYREIAVSKLLPVSGALELVKKLHMAKVPLAIGSSGPRLNVDLAVKTLGLSELIPIRVTGDDVIHGKPAPDIFLKAAEALGRSPSECVVIEDAPQGIRAAHAAGMKVIAVTGSRSATDLNEAHWVVESLTELDAEKIAVGLDLNQR
jgi:beta-phosphoglucomutase